jgi:hypothetical protein
MSVAASQMKYEQAELDGLVDLEEQRRLANRKTPQEFFAEQERQKRERDLKAGEAIAAAAFQRQLTMSGQAATASSSSSSSQSSASSSSSSSSFGSILDDINQNSARLGRISVAKPLSAKVSFSSSSAAHDDDEESDRKHDDIKSSSSSSWSSGKYDNWGSQHDQFAALSDD